jgi:hypothetical protein
MNDLAKCQLLDEALKQVSTAMGSAVMNKALFNDLLLFFYKQGEEHCYGIIERKTYRSLGI